MSSVIVDVYGERKAAKVMEETWGHLRAEQSRAYPGSIVFCHGQYGDLVLISVDFPEVEDSPWFFDGLMDWLEAQPSEPGRVYRFTGRYRHTRDDRHTFRGKVEETHIA